MRRITPSLFFSDRQQLVDLVVLAQTSPLGRLATKEAAQNNHYYGLVETLDSLGSDVAAFYSSDTHTIIIKKQTDKPDDETFRNETIKKFLFNVRNLGNFYHELCHYLQDMVWGTWRSPAQVKSFDDAAWIMAQEAQANFLAFIALIQSTKAVISTPNISYPDPSLAKLGKAIERGASRDKIDNDTLMAAFAFYIKIGEGHAKFYNFQTGRCSDNAKDFRDSFVKAFGFVPGRPQNFLSQKIAGTDDIRLMHYQNPLMKDVAEKAGCQIPKESLAPAVS